jgi:hypothetical protein
MGRKVSNADNTTSSASNQAYAVSSTLATAAMATRGHNASDTFPVGLPGVRTGPIREVTVATLVKVRWKASMTEINFKFGMLIRTGPKLVNGGKWDADLAEWVRNTNTNADPTIYIRICFSKIEPAGATGVCGDADDTSTRPSKRTIQKWRPGEFENCTRNLVTGAQRFWKGVFWRPTPLLGLGHVGTGGKTNVHNNNSPAGYGVTMQEMKDVMGKGSVRHKWHANPWQQAAEALTGVKAIDWKVFQHRIFPERWNSHLI